MCFFLDFDLYRTFGSARQLGETRILGGFLKDHIFRGIAVQGIQSRLNA